MLPLTRMNDEELETVVGGVTPNLSIRDFPGKPIPGEPGKGEDTQIIFI